MLWLDILITVELLSLHLVHRSRNPGKSAGTEIDLGFEYDQGEGIPRMYMRQMKDATILPISRA